jgi:tRNA nucleotidyltransferase/poly(A) polymerase
MADPCRYLDCTTKEKIHFFLIVLGIFFLFSFFLIIDKIIRFFYFHARYAIGDPDPVTLALCAEHANRIPDIIARKIDTHMFRCLLVPQISQTLELMRSLGILDHIFGFSIKDCAGVAALERVEGLAQMTPDSHSRLIKLLLSADRPPLETLNHIRQAWDMPEDSYRWKYNLLMALPYINSNMPLSMRQRFRQELGNYALKQLLLLGWSIENDPVLTKPFYQDMLNIG